MNHTERILLYNLQPADKCTRYQTLFEKLNIPAFVVSPDACANALGSLLGQPGFPAPISDPAESPVGEMMVFSGLSELQLDTVLRQIRAAGLPPVPLKAVATDTNIHWPLKKLYGHLLLEHMQMTGGR